MMTGPGSNRLWGEYPISTGQPGHWAAGELRLWYKAFHNEFWLATKHLPERGPEDEPLLPPEDTSWSRWALKEAGQQVRFVPVFPDRPVVAKPEYPFRLTRNAQARIYIRVPLWVRVELVGNSSLPLVEIPTVVLSSTWFGSFTSGDLCYWISTTARRQLTEDVFRSHLAVCPVHLVNTVEEELNVDEICLRVAGLSLFESEGKFWSDETRVAFRGSSEVSQVEVAGVAPPEARSGQLRTPPRVPLKMGLAAKTFAQLRDLPGLGLLSG